jgi:NADH dehydrogenase
MNDSLPPDIHTSPRILLITGATGFVGSGVLRALGRDGTNAPTGPFAGMAIRSLQRTARKPVSGIETVLGDVTDADSLAGKFDGVDTVIHLVGIIETTGETSFDSVIRQGTENVVAEARKAGIRHFIHMSALGAQDNPVFPYHQAKFRAEQTVKASGLDYTIFRPSVIFGEGDGFISVLTGVVRTFPVVPVVGDGKARFQPVHLDDVGASFAHVVANPEESRSKTYELGGAKSYSYEDMLDVIATVIGKRKPKVHVPMPLMKAVVRLSSPLPKALRPPVTMEQLKMLALDNSTSDSATPKLIGHEPVALENGISYVRGRS